MSSQVLVNTGSTLIQAVNDEEGGVVFLVLCCSGPPVMLFPGWNVASEIAMPQVCINSNSSSIDCKKTATGNGNLQPEIQINEYSSSKKLLE